MANDDLQRLRRVMARLEGSPKGKHFELEMNAAFMECDIPDVETLKQEERARIGQAVHHFGNMLGALLVTVLCGMFSGVAVPLTIATAQARGDTTLNYIGITMGLVFLAEVALAAWVMAVSFWRVVRNLTA